MPVDSESPDFLTTARERYDFGRTADADDRANAESDNAFANADNKDLGQWDEKAKRARKKRPILQWNRIPTYVQQVVNDGRQNKPAIQVAPGDGGTQETAEYFKARIRHVEYESNADTAKDTARDQQVTSGRGFERVSTEYVPGTNDQRICIDRIENQFSVVFDPSATKYDRSDADWCFVISLMSRDAHKRKYGEKSLINQIDFADAIKLAPEWIGLGADGEMIQVAEYFLKEYHERDIDGRKEQCATVWQYVINGAEVLSKTQWIGSTIPIIPVWGREATVDGKRRTYSLVRNAIDPQRLLNLYVSNIAELVGQQPKTPWAMPVGGVPAGSERDWQNAHNTPLAYLLYEPYDAMQRPLPAPTRIQAEPPIQALAIGVQQSIDGIKAAMGIFDASLGATRNDESGIAVQRRQKQSNITNYHFPDNEARSNKYLGEILVEIIPKIDKAGSRPDGTPRVYPVRTEDGKTHLVPIGVTHNDWKTGQPVCHDLMSGQYGVTVSTGPTHESQRAEAFDRDTALVTAQPELIFAIGPQMFRSDDTAGSEERAEALERYINLKFPGLIPPKDQEGQQIPPQVQQQIVGLQKKLQTTEQFAQSLHEQIATKQPELAMEKYKVDQQEETKRIAIAAKVDQLDATTLLHAELAKISESVANLHARQMQADQHAHEQRQSADTRQHAADMQDAQHSAALDQQNNAAALQPQEPSANA